MKVILVIFTNFSYKDEDVEGVGSLNGGVADITTKTRRSDMRVVRGGAWIILNGGIGACHGLKLDKGDDVEVESVSMTLGIDTLVDKVEGNPESWTDGIIVIMFLWGVIGATKKKK